MVEAEHYVTRGIDPYSKGKKRRTKGRFVIINNFICIIWLMCSVHFEQKKAWQKTVFNIHQRIKPVFFAITKI